MRNRATILVMAIGVAIFAVACGRASEEEIDELLGIVPTPTLSAEQIAQATEEANAEASAQAIAQAASPTGGSPEGVPAFDASQGDVALGRQQFQFKCQQCHRPDGEGAGPALSGANAQPLDLSDSEIAALVRDGHGTSNPIPDTTLSDKQLADLIAFIRSETE